jgi:hypothetical protein
MPDDDSSTPGTGLTLDAVWLEIIPPDLAPELAVAEDTLRRASARDPWGQQSQSAFEAVLEIKRRLWNDILCPRLLAGGVRVSYQPQGLTTARQLLPVERCANLRPPMFFGGGQWDVDGNILHQVLLHLPTKATRSAAVIDTTVSSEATNQGLERRLAQASGEAPPAVVTTLMEATNEQIDAERPFILDLTAEPPVGPPRKPIPFARLLRWHEDRVAKWPTNRQSPSWQDDLSAARAVYPNNHVTREQIRTVRRADHVPPSWHVGGRSKQRR